MSIPSCFPNLLATSTFEPFIKAYVDSDLIGRMIYLFLIALSCISWTLLFYKWWIAHKVQEESAQFKKVFLEQKHHPLAVIYQRAQSPEIPNAFFILYSILKNKTIEFMKKNREFEKIASIDSLEKQEEEYLLINDFSVLEAQASISIGTITKYLEKHLYILSTIVTLAPFLGLLGTVYGILVTFSGMSPDSGAGSTQHILGGLSLALTTTVIGLLNAIPALIGYSALKNSITDFEHEMERFSIEVLSTFDAHYRKRG